MREKHIKINGFDWTSKQQRRVIPIERLLVWAFDVFDAGSREVGIPVGPVRLEDEGGGGLRGPLMGAPECIDADAELVVEVVRGLEGEARDLVIASARTACAPHWLGGSFEGWRRRAGIFMLDRDRVWQAYTGTPACLPALARRGSNEGLLRRWNGNGHVVACEVVHVDRSQEIDVARRRYALWRETLVWLAIELVTVLTRWLPTGPAVPVEPWVCEPMMAAERALWQKC